MVSVLLPLQILKLTATAEGGVPTGAVMIGSVMRKSRVIGVTHGVAQRHARHEIVLDLEGSDIGSGLQEIGLEAIEILARHGRGTVPNQGRP